MDGTGLNFCRDDNYKRYFVDDTKDQNVPKLPQPKNHRATISVWTDLSVNDVDFLSQLLSAEQLRTELANIFDLKDHAKNLKSAVLLDLYYYTLKFARDNEFTKEQTSAFFSIVKKTHEVCIETPFGNVENCFLYFKDMVLCHAVKRPPFSVDLFNADEVRKISEYVINTYFRHFKLYKYTFTPQVSLDLSIVYVGLPKHTEQVEEEEVQEVEEPTVEVQEEKQIEAQPTEEDESAAMSQLRQLIRMHLSEELRKLRLSVDDQLKASEDSISKRLEEVEASRSANAVDLQADTKTTSAKGKKK